MTMSFPSCASIIPCLQLSEQSFPVDIWDYTLLFYVVSGVVEAGPIVQMKVAVVACPDLHIDRLLQRWKLVAQLLFLGIQEAEQACFNLRSVAEQADPTSERVFHLMR
jgi:hypothetical protein